MGLAIDSLRFRRFAPVTVRDHLAAIPSGVELCQGDPLGTGSAAEDVAIVVIPRLAEYIARIFTERLGRLGEEITPSNDALNNINLASRQQWLRQQIKAINLNSKLVDQMMP